MAEVLLVLVLLARLNCVTAEDLEEVEAVELMPLSWDCSDRRALLDAIMKMAFCMA
jgi:hypothetical protein